MIRTSLEAHTFYKRLTSTFGQKQKDCAEPLHNHGACYAHDHSKDITLYERSTAEKFACCRRFHQEGNLAFKDGNYKLAASFYQKVFIQLDYTFPEDDHWNTLFEEIRAKTDLNMALSQYKLENYNECIRYCDKVIKHTPENIKAHTTRGLSHIMLLKLKDAKKDFETILELDPDSKFAKEQCQRIDAMVFNVCIFDV